VYHDGKLLGTAILQEYGGAGAGTADRHRTAAG
jgi:hypothetical protein